MLNVAPSAPPRLPSSARLKEMYAVAAQSLKPDYDHYHLPKTRYSLAEIEKAAPLAHGSINLLAPLQTATRLIPFNLSEEQKQLLLGLGLIGGVIGAAYLISKVLT